MKATGRRFRKRAIIVGIVVPIALLHFFTGRNYRGPYVGFVNSYLLDILVPFAFYFLLCLPESSLLRHWLVRGALILGAASAVELAQAAGIPLFGQTSDPLDLLMYAVGVGLAVILDTAVLPRMFESWTPAANKTT